MADIGTRSFVLVCMTYYVDMYRPPTYQPNQRSNIPTALAADLGCPTSQSNALQQHQQLAVSNHNVHCGEYSHTMQTPNMIYNMVLQPYFCSGLQMHDVVCMRSRYNTADT